MKCSKCQFENREGAKFCKECGNKLELDLPKCESESSGQQVLWRMRSRPRSSQTPPLDPSRPASYTPKHLADQILTSRSALEGERKLVTVLFADVAYYTSLSEKLDPEEVHQIMDGCFQILMDRDPPLRGHHQPVHRGWGDGPLRRPPGPRGPCPESLPCGPGHPEEPWRTMGRS